MKKNLTAMISATFPQNKKDGLILMAILLYTWGAFLTLSGTLYLLEGQVEAGRMLLPGLTLLLAAWQVGEKLHRLTMAQLWSESRR